jgi:hypothetical protein
MRIFTIVLLLLVCLPLAVVGQSLRMELVTSVVTDGRFKMYYSATGQSVLRCSPHGVVVTLGLNGAVDRTLVVTVQGDSIKQRIFEGERIKQGVFSDDSTIYLARLGGRVLSHLASCNSDFENFRYYYERDGNTGGGWPEGIVAVEGAITLTDLHYRWKVKLPLDTTYYRNRASIQLNLGACEAFAIGDTVIHISDRARFFPIYAEDEDETRTIWYGRENALFNVTVDSAVVCWISSTGYLIEHDIRTGSHVETRVNSNVGYETKRCAGRHGGLYATVGSAALGTSDTTYFRYAHYGREAVFEIPVYVPVEPFTSVNRFQGGWSQGYFYLAISEDTNKVGIYRIKEPEPPVNVEENVVKNEVPKSQQLYMSREEFARWKHGRSSNTIYTDLLGRNINPQAPC